MKFVRDSRETRKNVQHIRNSHILLHKCMNEEIKIFIIFICLHICIYTTFRIDIISFQEVRSTSQLIDCAEEASQKHIIIDTIKRLH